MTDPDQLRALLTAVANGGISPEEAQARLKYFDFEPVGDFAKIDHHRPLRTGFAEAIWGQDKTPEQLTQIFLAMQANYRVVMATRVTPATYQQVRAQVRELRYYPLARICALGEPEFQPATGTIAIVAAGTSDIPVAEEAAVTAELNGFPVQRLWDVGISGIHRLLSHRHVLAAADVIIAVAGMEGALPSVVAGLADCPTIAVPTSIGYGASFGGVAPLLTMLNSCAAGVGVVNIDNGFGAAHLAAQILRTATRLEQRATSPLDPGDSSAETLGDEA